MRKKGDKEGAREAGRRSEKKLTGEEAVRGGGKEKEGELQPRRGDEEAKE